jgi:spore germination protein YaaH
VIPSVVTDLGAADFVACNSDPSVRAQHVAALVAVATSRNYDGLDFDYENFIFPAGDAEGLAVRSVFTALVGETCAALHQVGRVCSVTVMAKTNGAAFRGAGVYDYPALGAVADRFRVMTYDEHIGTDPPGPIAGYPWVNAVAAYIHSTVPADKVELGIPFYGRDWGGERTVTVTGPQAYALAARYGAPIAYDPVQRAPYFGYSDGTNWHTVWFTNAQMVSDRIALAASYGFTKTTYWAAGQEAPEVWTAIRAAG